MYLKLSEEHDKYLPEKLKSNASVLLCPNCNGLHTHQVKIEIYNGGEECSCQGTHISIDTDNNISIDNDMSGNPSKYRHGLIIHFYEEECGSDFTLSVYQHKGETFLSINETGEISKDIFDVVKRNDMEKIPKERFAPRKCPKCFEQIKPVTDGTINEMHGYKLTCPLCHNFIGWGGKANKVFQEAKKAKMQNNQSE